MPLDKPIGYGNNYYIYHDLYIGLAVVEAIRAFKVLALKCQENLTRICELNFHIMVLAERIIKSANVDPLLN